MAATGGVSYRVTNPGALRQAADPLIAQVAQAIQEAAAAATPHGPTGDLASHWQTEVGRAPDGQDCQQYRALRHVCGDQAPNTCLLSPCWGQSWPGGANDLTSPQGHCPA